MRSLAFLIAGLILTAGGPARAQDDDVDMEFEVEEEEPTEEEPSEEESEPDLDVESGDEEAAPEEEAGSEEETAPAGKWSLSGILDRLVITGTAELGLWYHEQAFAGGGASIAANYHIGDTRLALRLRLDGRLPIDGPWSAGLETGFLTSITGGGGDYPAGGVRMFRLAPFGQYQVNERVEVRAHLGYDLYLRSVDGAPPPLPSEREQGFLVGVSGTYTRKEKKWGARVELDKILGVGLAQTVGLRDGAESSGSVWRLALVGRYHYKPRLTLEAAFEVTKSTFDFTGANERDVQTQSGKRSAARNLLSVGAAWVF